MDGTEMWKKIRGGRWYLVPYKLLNSYVFDG